MIRIITDSTSSLTLAEYQKYDLGMIPLLINQGEIAKRELHEISYPEFYQKQRAGVKFTTTQAGPQVFTEAFSPIIAAGDEIICIILSSKISGTLNSAILAQESLNTDKISIIESRQSGAGQAYLALQAKDMAAAGMQRNEIVKKLEDISSRSRTYVVVESLKYLYEGGRLSGAQALVGSIIQLKPLIWFDREGAFTALEKIRTLKAAKARILSLIEEQAKLGLEKLAVQYGDNYDEAVELSEIIKTRFGIPAPPVQLSPVVAAHTGPDVLGVLVITKESRMS
ncbi:MAG TPA: DegV family protein [Bacillota bacterium]|nr:DegV family protein [Bacillota bacterium]